MNTLLVAGLQIPADTGCDLSPSCLRCPLPVCRYDLEGGVHEAMRLLRNREMRRLAARGVDSNVIAERYGVARRTVYRVLAEGKA